MEGIPMTQGEYDRLEAELERLEGPRRREVAEAISHARSFGDITENAEYDHAKEEQAHLEARIIQMRNRLTNADIVVPASRKANIGSVVEIEDEAGERFKVRLSNLVNPQGDLPSVSPSSPLGKALMGASSGQSVTVEAPRGSWVAKVVSVRADKEK